MQCKCNTNEFIITQFLLQNAIGSTPPSIHRAPNDIDVGYSCGPLPVPWINWIAIAGRNEELFLVCVMTMTAHVFDMWALYDFDTMNCAHKMHCPFASFLEKKFNSHTNQTWDLVTEYGMVSVYSCIVMNRWKHRTGEKAMCRPDRKTAKKSNKKKPAGRRQWSINSLPCME